jgi:hypothetical protein
MPKVTKTNKKQSGNKKNRKLPAFFSFSNRKFVLLLTLVVTIAGLGSWKLYQTSAVDQYGKHFPSVYQCNKFKPVLKVGTPKGGCIYTVQAYLNQHPYGQRTSGNKLSVDGIYGSNTAYSVSRYKSKVNLKADGVVSAKMWDNMMYWCRNYYPDQSFRNVCYVPN